MLVCYSVFKLLFCPFDTAKLERKTTASNYFPVFCSESLRHTPDIATIRFTPSGSVASIPRNPFIYTKEERSAICKPLFFVNNLFISYFYLPNKLSSRV